MTCEILYFFLNKSSIEINNKYKAPPPMTDVYKISDEGFFIK